MYKKEVNELYYELRASDVRLSRSEVVELVKRGIKTVGGYNEQVQQHDNGA
jgi:hypothetical protein